MYYIPDTYSKPVINVLILIDKNTFCFSYKRALLCDLCLYPAKGGDV